MIKTCHIKFLHSIMAKMQHGHPHDHGLMCVLNALLMWITVQLINEVL